MLGKIVYFIFYKDIFIYFLDELLLVLRCIQETIQLSLVRSLLITIQSQHAYHVHDQNVFKLNAACINVTAIFLDVYVYNTSSNHLNNNT